MNATIVFAGNLGSDPENAVTPNGAENIKFRVAVNGRSGQQDVTTWYSVTCWGGTAKGLTTLAQRGTLTKGAQVLVVGSLVAREYTGRDGQTRTSLDVNANEVQLLGAREDRRDDAREAVRAGAYSVDENMQGVPF